MKYKKVFFAAFMLLAASCGHDESLDSSVNLSNEQSQLAPVTVSVNGFSVEQGEFPETTGGSTRATAVGSYGGISFVTLAFYASDGTEVYKHTQNRDDNTTFTTFGNFSLDLPLGSYTMVVLGYTLYNDDEFTLTGPTQAAFTVGSPRETFAKTQAVNVTSTSALELSATLDRIVAQLKVISTDNRPANVSNVRMTFSKGGKQFSPSTGLATVNTGFSSTVSISSAVGERSGSISYLFLATDEQTMDVTIETLDSEGHMIYSTVVEDVPFKRNRRTKLTGSIYPTAATSSAFSVETDWLGDQNMNF